jgi:putative sigma-54 modulation protein
MRLELTARHITITPAIRKLVERLLAPTLRVLNDSAVSTQVVLTQEKARCKTEITLHARGEHFMHATGAGPDVGTSLSVAVNKIDRQATRLKGKWDTRRRRNGATRSVKTEAPVEIVPEVRVIRARRYPVRTLSIEEASADVGNSTDAFVVFRNASNDAVAVLFRRPDGNLGLIEPEG